MKPIATIALIVITVLISCDEPERKQLVTTADITEIKASSAKGGGEVTDNGGSKIIARGIVWSTDPSPTILFLTKTSDNIITGSIDSGVGDFKSDLTGLTPGTTYYVRAYGTNTRGTEYGPEVEFTTLPATTASLTTTVNKVLWRTAEGLGQVLDDGGSNILDRGFVWSENSSPTIELTTKISGITEGLGAGYFKCNLTGLTPGTKYYARAYAINSSGTGYGPEVSFVTLAADVPSVTTGNITSLGSRKSISWGEVTGDGGSAITERGLVWSTSPTPTTSLSTKTIDGTSEDRFTGELFDLSPNTKYYLRAYATNSTGTGYGDEGSFTTVAGNVLTVITSNVRVVRQSIGPFPWDPPGTLPSTIILVYGNGSIPDDGGSLVIARGLEYSTDPNMTTVSSTHDGSGAGDFETNLTPLLTPGNTYYVRAYAETASGRAHGETRSITVPTN